MDMGNTLYREYDESYRGLGLADYTPVTADHYLHTEYKCYKSDY